jgi:hypothetical protein
MRIKYEFILEGSLGEYMRSKSKTRRHLVLRSDAVEYRAPPLTLTQDRESEPLKCDDLVDEHMYFRTRTILGKLAMFTVITRH